MVTNLESLSFGRITARGRHHVSERRQDVEGWGTRVRRRGPSLLVLDGAGSAFKPGARAQDKDTCSYNALSGEYEDLVVAGYIDATKVVIVAL